MTDNEHEELREQIDRTMRPVVDKVITNATRPYKRTIVWLGIGYGVLVALSILQAVLVWTIQ